MTFVELATALDEAEQAVGKANNALLVEEATVQELKFQQANVLAAAEAKVKDCKEILAKKEATVASLYAQLHSRIPGTVTVVKPEQTQTELKALYQSGMKYRNNLG